MNRFEQLRKILDSGEYFKVVCGAGNEDPEEVYKLCMVYTLAGALGIDLSANVAVVKMAVKGVDRALALAPTFNIHIPVRPFLNVSVGLKGDPHVRKAEILADNCTACGNCLEVCEQAAIENGDPPAVLTHRCIGCGMCSEICDCDAVDFYTRKVDFEDILPKCLALGVENVELHATINDDKSVIRDWRRICNLVPNQFVSMCIDRSQLSDLHLAERVKQACEAAKQDQVIIQADGAPMSGGSDDYNTTLQAVACADIVQKSGIPVRILLSGGTNSRTGELAARCGLRVHGVSIGTFARKLVRAEISDPDFDKKKNLIENSIAKARTLVNENLRYIKTRR